jgi:hypothetical protein
VDNPNEQHLNDVKALASEANAGLLKMAQSATTLHSHGHFNYFVNVFAYGVNRGASHARNTGYILSPHFWMGLLPVNTWTKMLTGSNVMYFYGIAGRRVHPP